MRRGKREEETEQGRKLSFQLSPAGEDALGTERGEIEDETEEKTDQNGRDLTQVRRAQDAQKERGHRSGEESGEGRGGAPGE